MTNFEPFTDYWSQVINPLEQQGLLLINASKCEALVARSAFYVAACIAESELEDTAPSARALMIKKMAALVKNLRMYIMYLASAAEGQPMKHKPDIAIHVFSDTDFSAATRPLPLYSILLRRRRSWHTLWLFPTDHFDVVVHNGKLTSKQANE